MIPLAEHRSVASLHSCAAALFFNSFFLGLKEMFWNIFGGLRHISQVANSMRRLLLTKALSKIKRRNKGEGLKACGFHYRRKYGITL
ncbi:hypothetical protein K1719_003700 [Acacia pycnantha]|nr:hypothetical protein K1719_003700 [Acacia pycnantha]